MSFDWTVWFWFLIAVLALAFSVCLASTIYGLCSRRGGGDRQCIACSCCNYSSYNTLTAEDDIIARAPSSNGRLTPESIAHAGRFVTGRSPIVVYEQAPKALLTNAAQVKRARRLMPRCKIIKHNIKSPIFLFRQSRKYKNDICPICLDQYTHGESLVLSRCRHAYHLNCLEGWLKVKGTCPLCKRPIRNELTERSPLLYAYG